MICTTCSAVEPVQWKGPIKVFGVQLFGHGEQCPKCGEVQFDREELDRQERAAVDAIVELGIRAGAEMKIVRKRAGLKRTAAARLLDVTPDTVSRWEADAELFPQSAAVRLVDFYERSRKREPI